MIYEQFLFVLQPLVKDRGVWQTKLFGGRGIYTFSFAGIEARLICKHNARRHRRASNELVSVPLHVSLPNKYYLQRHNFHQ